MADQFTATEMRSFRGVTCVMHGHSFRQGACDSCANCGHMRRDHNVDSALSQAATTLDRIEQMREWLAKQRVDITGRKSEFMAGCATENTLTVNQFSRLFPKGKE